MAIVVFLMKRLILENNRKSTSPGQVGSDGKQGGTGGNGGDLTINTFTHNYLATFSARKGEGGIGGEGGEGGTTLFREIIKILPGPDKIRIWGPIKRKSAPKGEKGQPGIAGREGLFVKNVINILTFNDLVTKEYIDDWKTIEATNWRVLFRNKES